MDNQIFKETGVGSIAWFLQVFKKHPEKRGYSFIRNESINNYTGQYPKLTAQIQALVAGGYMQKQGKEENPRSMKYVVTSFGHRYLEQHREEAGIPDTAPPVKEATITPKEALAEAQKRVNEKSAAIADKPVEKVSDLLHRQFSPMEAPEFKPTVPETPEQRKKMMGLDLRRGKNLLPGGEPMGSSDEDGPDDAFDDIRTPKVRAVAEDMPEPTAEAQPGDDDDATDSDDHTDGDDLVSTLKRISGEILYDRHAKEVTVVDLIERIEKQ